MALLVLLKLLVVLGVLLSGIEELRSVRKAKQRWPYLGLDGIEQYWLIAIS